MKLVLSLNRQDTGGQGYKLKEAFIRYSAKYTFRNIIRGTSYLNYPVDINSKHNPSIYKNLLKKADLLHIHDYYDRSYSNYGTTPKNIPKLLHQHGRRPDKENLLINLDKRLKLFRIVSAIGIIKYVDNDPEKLLPSPIDLDYYDKIKINKKESNKIIIGHSPTNREIKNTDLLIETVKKLKMHHPEVELKIIERKPYKICINEKTDFDIYFDQLREGYGNNAVESWGFRQPCVLQVPDEIRDIFIPYFGQEPWCNTNEDTLYRVLEELVSDPEYRKKMGDIGRSHVEKFHDYPIVVKRLENFYEKAVKLFNEESS